MKKTVLYNSFFSELLKGFQFLMFLYDFRFLLVLKSSKKNGSLKQFLNSTLRSFSSPGFICPYGLEKKQFFKTVFKFRSLRTVYKILKNFLSLGPVKKMVL
ncbi:MAG: hypothetical protein JST26_05680 [Bacteroidetes bacterium]|nr:hypothetical protein [Bacteroidota bacterium]